MAAGSQLFELYRHPLEDIRDNSLLPDELLQGSGRIIHASVKQVQSEQQIICVRLGILLVFVTEELRFGHGGI